MIDKESSLCVVKQCRLLGVSRASVYYQQAPVSAEDLSVMRVLGEVHLLRPFLGSRRLVDELAERGVRVNRKRTQRLMRLMGIEATYPKPNTSKAVKEHKVYPYLLRDVVPERANQVWDQVTANGGPSAMVTYADITYLPMAKGFCYLVAIMDLYSRRILSWRLSNTLDVRFCVASFEEALETYGSPDIFNTDQGAQFTARAFTRMLEQRGVHISMDGKGRWIDNVFIERFWRSLKYEEVYLYAYADLKEAKRGVERYICYYNGERRHSSLDKQTPDKVYTLSTQPLPTPLVPEAAALTPRPCS